MSDAIVFAIILGSCMFGFAIGKLLAILWVIRRHR